MDFTEDLGAILGDFGTTATLASGAAVVGVFDAASVDVLTAASIGPTLLAKTSEVGALAYGAALTISGTAYLVRQNEPDGTGMTRLILELS